MLHSGTINVKSNLVLSEPSPPILQVMGSCTGTWEKGYDIVVSSALPAQYQYHISLVPRPHLSA